MPTAPPRARNWAALIDFRLGRASPEAVEAEVDHLGTRAGSPVLQHLRVGAPPCGGVCELTCVFRRPLPRADFVAALDRAGCGPGVAVRAVRLRAGATALDVATVLHMERTYAEGLARCLADARRETAALARLDAAQRRRVHGLLLGAARAGPAETAAPRRPSQ